MSISQNRIIFIDSQVEDYQGLANGVLSGIETVILDSQDNGIEQITSVLSQKNNVTSIHIVSHGDPGCLYLGNTSLSLDTLYIYQKQLKTWLTSSNLNQQEVSGNISIYGCNVAAGDAGGEFITKLYQLTGAEIAASTTPIGSTAKGGNWELNRTTSNQPIELAFNSHTRASYAGIFAAEEFSLGNRIWLDANNNGQIDDGESGVDGVVVNLYQDSDNDGNADGAAIATDSTADGGYYRFDNLAAGDYIVEVAASNFESGQALARMSSSSPDEVEPNDDIDGNDNGIGTTPDATKGIRSNTVTLASGFSEPTEETDIDPTFPTSITTTRTDSSGVPATSTIRINAVDGGGRPRFDGDANFANRFVIDIPGYGENLTGFCIEFGEFVKSSATYTNVPHVGPFFNSSYNDANDIQNFFGVDPNADNYGIVTQNELDLISTVWANVEDNLLNDPKTAQALQVLIWELQNDQTFDLTSGNFFLDATASFSSTVGANTTDVINTVNGWVDSVNSGAWTGSLPLAMLSLEGSQDLIVNLDLGVGATDSQSNLTVDFGFVPEVVPVPTYKLSGTVFDNTQAPDAAQIDNPGDTPLGNVTVELFNSDGNVIASTTTNADGFYEFSDLANGDYVIVESQPDGYDSVTDIDGIDDNQISVTIAGEDVINQDFLEQVAPELIIGTAFSDHLYGTVNDDYIDAQEGNDIIYSSLGADTLVGGSGTDFVLYRYSDAAVSVDLSANTAMGGDAEGDTFDSIEILYGSRFNDVLVGDENNNRLYGQRGNDSLEGGAGNDKLLGGSGNDTLWGDANNDYLSGGRGNDILTGASLSTNGVGEIDRLKGNRGADMFILGTDSNAFYDDGDNTSNGRTDYALILDFNQTEDVIQLFGEETYYLDANPAGTSYGTGIFIDNDGTAGFTPEDELVGVIKSEILTAGMINEFTPGFEMV